MILSNASIQRGYRRLAALALGGAFSILGFVESCDDKLVNATRYVDPCGTVFANCQPGDFIVNAAEVGDWSVDPACTVPGLCSEDQPLGTITELGP